MRILFILPNEPMLNPPPVNLGIFAAILKNKDFELDLFDTTYYPTFTQTSDKAKEDNLQVRPFDYAERNVSFKESDLYQDLREKVETFGPDLIAIPILEPTFAQAVSLLDTIAAYDIPVVAGGVFPTFAPKQVLSHPAVNMVCIGEGEGTLLELCETMREKRDISTIRNLWIKNGSGALVKNRIRSVVELDMLPLPDYDLFEPERFFRPMAGKVYRAIPVETNRGCPFHCAYCNSPSQIRLYRDEGAGNFFRKKSMARIKEELEYLIPLYNAEYVYFPSDTFLSMTNREFKEFVDVYSAFRLPFWVQTRPETITKERAFALREIGCHRMSIGVEHGNYYFRKEVLRKNIPNRVIIQACEAIAEAGIPLSINNIIGFPGETRGLVFDTINLNRELKFDTTNAYVFSPFHGTPLWDVCVNEGLISEDTTVRNLTIDAVLDMPQLPKEEVEGLRRTFALYARMPKEYWPDIERAEVDDEEGNRRFQALREEYIGLYF